MTDFAIEFEGTKGTYTLAVDSTRHEGSQPCPSLPPRRWEFSRSGEIVTKPLEPAYALDDNRKQPSEIKPIPRISVASKESFEDVLQKCLPIVIEGVDLGPCRNNWTLKYLTAQIGKDRKVRKLL